MARKPRVHVKNAVYHVIMHGPPNGSLFDSASDRNWFLHYLEVGIERYGHQVLAYCLLKNQVNLVIRVADIPLARIIQNLSFRYTRYVNNHYGQDGALFYGRYRGVLIDPERYLLDLVRYVHHEPKRQSRSADPARFKGSSYSAYLDDKKQPWLSKALVLDRFGKTRKSAIAAFKRFHAKSGDDQDETNFVLRGDGGRVLGSRSFVQKMLKVKPESKPKVTLPEVVRYVCRQEGVREAALKTDSRARDVSQIRQVIACVAVDLRAATLTEVADRYRRDLTTMSRNQRYFRDKMADDEMLQKKISRYQRDLSSGK